MPPPGMGSCLNKGQAQGVPHPGSPVFDGGALPPPPVSPPLRRCCSDRSAVRWGSVVAASLRQLGACVVQDLGSWQLRGGGSGGSGGTRQARRGAAAPPPPAAPAAVASGACLEHGGGAHGEAQARPVLPGPSVMLRSLEGMAGLLQEACLGRLGSKLGGPQGAVEGGLGEDLGKRGWGWLACMRCVCMYPCVCVCVLSLH